MLKFKLIGLRKDRIIDKKRAIVRMAIIFVPFIFSLFFLFNPFERIELTRTEINENLTMVKVSKESVSQPTLKNMVRGIFGIPFDLEWYDICFVNKGTKMIYGNNIAEDKNVTVNLDFNNQKKFTLQYRKKECVVYGIDKDSTYQWNFVYQFEYSNEGMVFEGRTFQEGKMHPEVDAYAEPEKKSIIVKNILVLISWAGLVWLATRIYKFVLYGD